MPTGNLNSNVRPTRQNLRRLCLIRHIVIVLLLAGALWLWAFGSMDLPWQPLLLVLVTMLAINIGVAWRLRSERQVSENEFFANLMVDIAFLTLVLYFTGGSTNPLVSYYLIPLIISAAVLRPAYTRFIALLSIGLYTLLLFHYQPFSLFTMHGMHAMSSAHFVGMWINFVFSALLISWFVVRMANTLREQSQAIARSREEGLRNEQIISVASIAAGTAHEMRTPLSTMAVTVDDIANEHPELGEEMALLQQQIERCDAVLRELVSTTTEDSQMVVTEVSGLWHSLMEKWSLARPEVKLQTLLPADILELKIRYDQSLQHALMSFLNNAADASPDSVVFQAQREADSVLFIIEDQGAGIPPEIADQLGKTKVTRKQEGLGLGVLLSQASIERLGGEVSLQRGSQQQGTKLLVSFPLVLEADDE